MSGLFETVDHALDQFRAVIAGHPDFQEVFVHLKSDKNLSFSLEAAKDGRPPYHLFTMAMNLRLIKNGNEGWAHGPVTDIESMRSIFGRALNALTAATAQPKASTPFAQILRFSFQGNPSTGKFADETFALIPEDEKVNRLINLETATLKDLPPKTSVTAHYKEGFCREAIWHNSTDKPLVSEWTEAQISLSVTSEADHKISTFFEEVSESSYFDLDWTRLARHSANTVSSLLTGRSIELHGMRFIAHPNVCRELVSLLGRLLDGREIASGKSALAGRLNEVVFSTHINVFDDPHFRKKPRSRFWDSEGQMTYRVRHIENGQFRTPMIPNSKIDGLALDSTSQIRFIEGVEQPVLSFHNLLLEPGNKDYVDLVRDLTTGAVLTRFDRLNHFDVESGDFTAVVSGQRLENGQLLDAFAEAVLKGNIIELFRDVQAVGRDLSWFGGVAAPSILCENKARRD